MGLEWTLIPDGDSLSTGVARRQKVPRLRQRTPNYASQDGCERDQPTNQRDTHLRSGPTLLVPVQFIFTDGPRRHRYCVGANLF
jgi:hypothetical protein